MDVLKMNSSDYLFWMRASYWTIEEGAAVALGINPKALKPQDEAKFSRFEKYEQLVELGKRAQKVNKLEELPNPIQFLEWLCSIDFVDIPKELLSDDYENDPFRFFGIAGRNDWNPSFSVVDYKSSYEGLEKLFIAQREELQELRRESWEFPIEWEDSEVFEAKPKIFEKRQRNSLLKILLSVAVEKYRYNPAMERSSVPKNIESATDRCGLSVTDETIRDYLKMAIAEFPSVLSLFDDQG